MAMDAKDIQLDLQALKRLYGLLQKNEDGTSNTASDVLLDEHARLLLKNQLDAATRRVLKIVEAPGTVSPTHQQLPDESSEERSFPIQELWNTVDYSQNFQKKLGSDEYREPDGSNTTLGKEKGYAPQWSQDCPVEQPILNAMASAPKYRKKRCRICQRNTSKQLEPQEEMHFYSVGQNSIRFSDLQHKQNNESDRFVGNSKQETGLSLSNQAQKSRSRKDTGPLAGNLNGIESRDFPSNRVIADVPQVCSSDTEPTSKPEEVDFLSKEASKAIEHIELCISTFHLGEDHSHSPEGSSAQPRNCDLETKSTGPAALTQHFAVPSVEMNQREGRFVGRNNFQYELSSQRFKDPADNPLHQVPPIVAADEMNPPYLSLNQIPVLVEPSRPMWKQPLSNAIKSRGLALGQNVQAVVDSGNWIRGWNDLALGQFHAVQDFSVVMDPNEASSTTDSCQATFPSASEMKSPYQSHMAIEQDTSRHRTFQTHEPADSFVNLNKSENFHFVDSKLNVTSTSGVHWKTHPAKAVSATFIDRKPSQISLQAGFRCNQYKDGISKNRNSVTGTRTALPRQESDGTTTDSYSSTRRSQQTSNCGTESESEEYSLPDRSREIKHHVASRTSSETGPSHGTGSWYDSYTSEDGEDEICTSTSAGASRGTSSRSSGIGKDYSSHDQPINHHAGVTYSSLKLRSKGPGPGRTQKSSKCKNHKKQSGSWKRLKDRLAIIFHHHHHHHHHHHGNQDDRGKDRTKMNRNASLQKHKGRIISSPEENGERAAEETTKSLVLDKSQQRNFHGLVGGLLRQVRQSKKFNPGKEMAKGQHNSRKKTLKKSHWWQLLQHHSGAKLPNRTRLKLELGKSKTRLEAVPRLR